MPLDPGDYRYDPPTDSPFNDIDQYVPILLAAVDDWLDYPNIWPEESETDALGYMEDLKAWIQELSNTMFTPIGSMMEYMGASAPDGWLMCNGNQYNQDDYPELTAVLPAILKSGSVFTVPDMRGRMPVGENTSVGMFQRGTTGGEREHVLTISEMPSHNHLQDAHNHSQQAHNHTQDAHNHAQDAHNHTQNGHSGHSVNVKSGATAFGSGGIALASVAPDTTRPATGDIATNLATTATNQASTATNQAATAVNNATTATNQSTGGNVAHNNMPPYFAVNFIIRAK